MTQIMTDERRDSIIGDLNEYLRDVESYVSEHADSGGNYVHLLGESDGVDESDLLTHCEAIGLDVTGLESDDIAQGVYDGFRMLPGDIYTPTGEFFVADGIGVGEIEESLEYIMGEKGITIAELREVARDIDAALWFSDKEGSPVYAYVCTSAVWYFVYDDSVLREHVANLRANYLTI